MQKSNNDLSYAYIDKTCPVCGKVFCTLTGQRWAYQTSDANGHKAFLCRWSCLCEFKRRVEALKADSGRKYNSYLPKSLDGLERVRESRGMTKTDLAHAAGLSTYIISMYESGGCKPSLRSLRKLTDVLGVSAEELMKEG